MPVDTNAQINVQKSKTKTIKNELVLTGKNNQSIKLIKTKNKTIKKTITMPILATAGLLTAASSLLGAGANAAATGNQNRKNRRFTREMFDKTNAYNTPLQQVKRMKEAGLNPAQMYGSGSSAVTSSSSASQPTPPKQEVYHIPENLMADVAQKLAGAKLADSQAELAKANTDLTNQKVPLTEAQTDLTKQQTETNSVLASKLASENARIQQEYRFDQTLFNTNVQYRNAQLELLRKDVAKAQIEINNLPGELQAKIELLKNQGIESQKRSRKLDTENWIFENQKELRSLNINPDGGLIDTVAKYIMGSILGAKKYLDTQN